MNIFALHPHPRIAAHWLCNAHVVKMISESAEMLLHAHVYYGGKLPVTAIPYRSRHANHPCTVWARTSIENYLWLQQHADQLYEEYWQRYGQWKGEPHDFQWEIAGWLSNHPLKMREQKQTPFACAISNQEIKAAYLANTYNIHEAYRLYYIGKQHTMKVRMCWPDEPPKWWDHNEIYSLYNNSLHSDIVNAIAECNLDSSSNFLEQQTTGAI